MKQCTKCKESKDLSLYNRNKNPPDGLTWWCKACCLLKVKDYKKKHKAEIREYKKSYVKRTTYRVHKQGTCVSCNFVAIHACQLDVDHIDGNHSNNDPANLQTLCANCHRLKSFLNRDSLNKIYKVVG